MKINSLNSFKIFQNNKSRISFSQNLSLKVPNKDIFVCSANQTNTVNKSCDISQLYDEVWEIFRKQNPIFDSLNVPKPKLEIVNTLEDVTEDGIACYDFASNKISIDKQILDSNYYIGYLKNTQGTIPEGVFRECKIEEMKNQFEKLFPSYKFECAKLTQEEKILWLKSTIAHELRHCLQNHLLSCMDEKYTEETKSKIQALIKLYQQLIKVYKAPLNYLPEGKEKTQHIIEYNKAIIDLEKSIREYSYIFNYKPSVKIGDNALLKFSIDNEDRRYWSLKNHLLKSAMSYNNSNPDIYYNSPLEIDAYNYQKDFIFSQAKNFNADRIVAMVMGYAPMNDDRIKNLQNNGFGDLIVK